MLRDFVLYHASMPDFAVDSDRRAALFAALKKHWGYDSLRPMQEEAIWAAVGGRDSVVILPTGGGKSLCYQLPPLVRGGVDLVVSPLISLMKDQVDGLLACGYPAVGLHSGMSEKDVDAAERAIVSGEAKLIFAAPERLLSWRMRKLLERVDVRAIVVDEAHCISHWGHDFRPEYRRLIELRTVLPNASWHAFTATATQRVREDIVAQLRLRDPLMLVGNCDRPNLTYRVLPRLKPREQLKETLSRHRDRAVIVYCISRKSTEDLAEWLRSKGVHAQAYHAGLTPKQRQKVQDAFMQERLHVVVATVAFGMGIDRSDVRCVVHMTMPKSIEHYQQEAGRAGRDGLSAECTLFYSSADVMAWRRLMTQAAQEAGQDGPPAHHLEMLEHMRRYCSSMTCRHRALAAYFGQTYEPASCGACDVCLNEAELVRDSVVTAQKVLSCVARLESRFGANHVVDVLRGSRNARVLAHKHDELSVFGLLARTPTSVLQSYIDQLVDHGALERTEGDRPVVRLTSASRDFLRGQRDVVLRRPKVIVRGRPGSDADWEGVDRNVFERLRALRREIAQEREMPAFMIFGDQTLRELARVKPRTREEMIAVRGVGQQKLVEFGDAFLAEINDVLV